MSTSGSTPVFTAFTSSSASADAFVSGSARQNLEETCARSSKSPSVLADVWRRQSSPSCLRRCECVLALFRH